MHPTPTYLGALYKREKGKKQFLEISNPFELVSRSNTLLALVVNKWLDTRHAIKNCKSLFQKKKNIPSKKVEFDKNCTFFSILEHYATMISDSP